MQINAEECIFDQVVFQQRAFAAHGDAGMFAVERIAAAGDVKAAHRRIRGRDRHHIACAVALDGGHSLTDQRQRLVNQQRRRIDAGGHVDRVARLRGSNSSVQVKARLRRDSGGAISARTQRLNAKTPRCSGAQEFVL